MASLDWLRRWTGGGSPPSTPLAAPESPPSETDSAMVEALLALDFDADAYLADYPSIGVQTRRECVQHFHRIGRGDWLRVRFGIPFAEAQARIDTLVLTEVQRDQLRIDLAASALWQADTGGGDAHSEDLLRENPAYQPLAVVSDSHGALYLSEEPLWAGRWGPIPLLSTGASARGLGNPDSRMRAGRKIRDELRRLEGSLARGAVLFKFGQVDLEFVYDYRRIRDGRRAFDLADAQDFARDSARRYLGFLDELRRETPLRLVVTAALPPALNDEALREGYMNAHIAELYAELPEETLRAEIQRLDMPDWKTRTGLAALFNAELAAGCAKAGLIYCDDFTPLLGPDGVISPDAIVWHGGANHHLCATSRAARAVSARVTAALRAMADRGWT